MIGSRSLGRRAPGAQPWHAVLGTRLCVGLMNLLAGARATDLGPFRAISAETRCAGSTCATANYGWTVEMQVKAARAGLRVVEVPVDYRPRVGKSKVSGTVRGTVGAGTKIIATILRYALPANPVVLGACGLVLTGCVLSWLWSAPPPSRIAWHLASFGLAFVAYLIALAASRGVSRRGLCACLAAALVWRACSSPPRRS